MAIDQYSTFLDNAEMNIELDQYVKAGLDNQAISCAEAREVLTNTDVDPMKLIMAAGEVRKHFHSNTVSVHILNNVRNGACPEDCGYCGQATNSDAPIQPYKMKSPDEILQEAKAAKASGAYRYCMALSGRGPKDRDIDQLESVISTIASMGLKTCLSAGLMDESKAQRLKAAGLDRLNHNLNTSEAYYEKICTTHTYQDRIDTLMAARKAGLGVCSGMIVGMGESIEDILQVAFRLRDIKAESIPVNFLLPIDGNPVNQPRLKDIQLTPWFVLRVLAMFRFVNPDAEIRIAAGREYHLRSLQPLALWPANSLFMDGYLLSKGSEAEDTLKMIRDAGFQPAWPEGVPPEALSDYFQSDALTHEQFETSFSPQIQPELINAAGLKPQVVKQPKEPGNFVPIENITGQ